MILHPPKLPSGESDSLSRSEHLRKFGLYFQKIGEVDLAMSVYDRVLELGGDDADVRFNMGSARLSQTRPRAAINHFEAALRLDPRCAGAHLGLANSQQQIGDLMSAEANLRQEMVITPGSAEAAVNLGWVLEEQNRTADALRHYQQALRSHPNHADLRWNHALVRLKLGDYPTGWAEYEWRWPAQKKDKPVFDQPEWDGSPLRGRRLLIYGEQGLGDTLMFARFGRKLALAGAAVLLRCQPSLKRLLQQNREWTEVNNLEEPLPEFDVHVPIMSLPRLLNEHHETNLYPGPYLNPPLGPPANVPPAPQRNMKICVTWGCNPGSPSHTKRSVPYEIFQRLFEQPGCHFYNVQVNAEATAIADMNRRANVHDLSQHLRDFADTAAVVRDSDLVITVDTALAHLAGGLGKPVWTLVPFSGDWRWLMNRSDSPWYPTMRLFRQPNLGDWESVIADITHCLTRRVRH